MITCNGCGEEVPKDSLRKCLTCRELVCETCELHHEDLHQEMPFDPELDRQIRDVMAHAV